MGRRPSVPPSGVRPHAPRARGGRQAGRTTFAFVTDGIEAALDRARAAAGQGDVQVSGGADVAQQYLRAGLLDELQLHVVPVLLGDGVRLFEGHVAGAPVGLDCTRALASPTGVTHLRYRILR